MGSAFAKRCQPRKEQKANEQSRWNFYRCLPLTIMASSTKEMLSLHFLQKAKWCRETAARSSAVESASYLRQAQGLEEMATGILDL